MAVEQTASWTSRSTGSTRKDTDAPASSALVKKLVKQESITTFDSGFTDLRDSARREMRPHGSCWQLDIRGRSRQFVGFRWRLMFESPRIEKRNVVDIVATFDRMRSARQRDASPPPQETADAIAFTNQCLFRYYTCHYIQ